MVDEPTVCERCKCCSTCWHRCEAGCDEGGTGQSNCIDDICNGGPVPCMHGDDVEYPCLTCDGKGGWWTCGGCCLDKD